LPSSNCSSALPPSPTFNSASKRSAISLSKKPQYPLRPISVVQETHNASQFQRHLRQYLNTLLPNPLSVCVVESSLLPFHNIDVYTMFHFHPEALQDDELNENDIVRAIPCSPSLPSGRYDTVIVMESNNAEATGLEGIKADFIEFTFSNFLSQKLGLHGSK
jgi:hypothetical protein